MARYDQGGGCACGLERWCSCGSGQANGRSVEADRKAAGYIKTSDGGWRKDRTDHEGGIPGRYMDGDVCGHERTEFAGCTGDDRVLESGHHRTAKRKVSATYAGSLSRRGAISKYQRDLRIAELAEEARIKHAVERLTPRARKVWQRLKAGKWYKPFDPSCPQAMNELEAADLVVRAGSPMVIAARWLPIGSTVYSPEHLPENLP